MILTQKIGFYGFYGAITSTIIGLITSVIINLYVLSKDKDLKVKYNQTFKILFKVVYTLIIMCIVLTLMKYILPITGHGRMTSLLIILIYAIVGGTIYFVISFKNNVIKEVLGEKFIDSIVSKTKKILHINKRQKTNA